MVINNPQNNTPVEWVNQDIYNMIVTNYLSKKLFIYIDTCHYILPCVSCLMTAYYHNTLKLKTVKTVFSGEIIFNLLSILHFPGSAPHYVFLWGFYYGLSHRTILLTCHNMLVHYYVYCWFDIIKSYGYELNKGLTFKIIPNEFKVRINEQVYLKKNHWWNK